MGILDKAVGAIVDAVGAVTDTKGRFGVSFGIPGAENWEFARLWQKNLEGSGSRRSLADPYATHATVATAISILCEDAAIVPWDLYETPVGDRKQNVLVAPTSHPPVDDHPLYKIWQHPNDYMDGNQFWIGTYLSMKVFGECFWYYPDLVLAPPGAPESVLSLIGGQIRLLDPRSIKHKISSGGDLSWHQMVDGDEERLDARRLTQFKRWNPYNYIRGLPEIASLIAEISGDAAAAEWNLQFFDDQNGIPSGLLVPTNEADMLSPTQERDVLRRFNSRHGRHRRVGMLPAGWDWKSVGIDHQRMDFKELRQMSREQILGLFGVPPFRAGVLENANYANAREQDKVYWNGPVRRFLSNVKTVIDNNFLRKLGMDGYCAHPRWDMIRQELEDTKAKVETASALRALGIPLSLINTKLSMGYDLEGVPGADEPFMPVNMAPVRLLLEGGSEDSGTENIDGATPGTDDDDATVPDQRAIFAVRQIQKVFEMRLRGHVKSMRDDAEHQLDGLKGFLATKGEIPDGLFNEKKLDAEIRSRLAGCYTEAVKTAFSVYFPSIELSSADLQSAGVVQGMLLRASAINRKLIVRANEAFVQCSGSSPNEAKAIIDTCFRSMMRSTSEIAKSEMKVACELTRSSVAVAAG